MIISSKYYIGKYRYRDDGHREDATHFNEITFWQRIHVIHCYNSTKNQLETIAKTAAICTSLEKSENKSFETKFICIYTDGNVSMSLSWLPLTIKIKS